MHITCGEAQVIPYRMNAEDVAHLLLETGVCTM
jgi:hypothetical protein